ncbi:MAG: type II/IV secretion system protein [Gammaproteobacteria bacterium]|nr:MAG: type II/IV secretion system protein [Gammaproteobacteria bacterium]
MPPHLIRDMEAKIRMKAKLPLSERRAPLDGRFHIEAEGRMVDMRLSIVPTRTGQSIVCRLLDQANAGRRLDEIDMTPAARKVMDDILAHPNGLFLVTGPTGSGKTTTLYAALNEVNTPERKVITVEDPVEYRLRRGCQINVDETNTFARALRAILRQDPDVILVGEIRDAETARIAVQAAMTGHLVLSTLHANDAATSITRLADLGVDPFTLGVALRAVSAQRLVRRLCTCAVPVPPGPDEALWLERFGIQGDLFYVPAGCERCGDGFAGRIPVIEMIAVDPPVRAAIDQGDVQAIRKAAMAQPQFETLAQAGARLAREGKTTLAEAIRITGEGGH